MILTIPPEKISPAVTAAYELRRRGDGGVAVVIHLKDQAQTIFQFKTDGDALSFLNRLAGLRESLQR